MDAIEYFIFRQTKTERKITLLYSKNVFIKLRSEFEDPKKGKMGLQVIHIG